MKSALVIDDTKAHRLLISRCLENENFQVETAAKGKEAVDLLVENTYDIIFLDIKMPFMSGTSVLEWMRKNDILTPVVIVTAYATVKNALDCTRLGAISYVQKPLTQQKLKKLMQELEEKYEVYKRKSENIHINKDKVNSSASQKGKNNEALHFDIQRVIGLFNKAKYKEALEYLKELLARDPSNAEIYLWLSKSYSALGNAEYADKFSKTYQIFK